MPKIDDDGVDPFWQTTDGRTVRLYHGHVTDVLRGLPDGSVHMCVTSPPYWGLRAYATGGSKHLEIGAEPSPDCKTDGQAQCGRCFVCTMVAVFREVQRVLRDDGTLWLNLGDSYSSSGVAGPQSSAGGSNTFHGGTKHNGKAFGRAPSASLPSGNLVGVPWRVALALQADGWVLRQDVIWHKPSPMPESVRNRCTKAHEYVFLLTKSAKYFYDAEAIKEKAKTGGKNEAMAKADPKLFATRGKGTHHPDVVQSTSNRRSVWTIPSQGYEGAHFATFPPKLIEPMIKAGTSEKGCCARCGAPWRRVMDEKKLTRKRPNDYVKRTGEEGTGNSCANSVAGVEVKTVGWQPMCECHGRLEKQRGSVRRSDAIGMPGNSAAAKKGGSVAGASEYFDRTLLTEEVLRTDVAYVSDLLLDKHPVAPCTVLDPFIGSGTTCEVALRLGRDSIGIDLSEQYLRKNAIPRVEGVLLPTARRVLVPRKTIKAVVGGRPIGK